MAIDTLADLADLSVGDLYQVYLAIARSDHQWRLRTMYGDEVPPVGHTEFRPLGEEQFQQRLIRSRSIPNGESLLRRRLARQAAAYEVDIPSEVTQRNRAA